MNFGSSYESAGVVLMHALSGWTSIVVRGPLSLMCVVWLVPSVTWSDTGGDFFEAKIRPLLLDNCVSCHGAKKQESGLRLDSRAAILKGGDSGAAVRLGKPDMSLIVAAVTRTGDLKMPPNKPFSTDQVAAISKWVQMGLPWPDTAPMIAKPTAADSHWAFKPVVQPHVPNVVDGSSIVNDIDRFIIAKLADRQLELAPAASPATLIRRATFDLLGLPPTPEEVSEFTAAADKDFAAAWQALIGRLLESPHYGERQARFWLDVARYADNKGYVFFEEKNFPWAWTYRDWVVRAFNEDLPYDQFVLQQLAADLLAKDDRRALAAMGFLTLGPRFMNNTHDVLDDRIDVVTRGLLGLTVTCARCHDHKFDPIPQEDYYSLYGVFRSSIEPTLRPLLEAAPDSDQYRSFHKGMLERTQKLDDFIETQRAAMMAGSRNRAAEYLLAVHKKRNHPNTENFMLLTDKGAIIPAMVHRWEVFLKRARRKADPVWTVWFRFSDLADDNFAAEAKQVHVALFNDKAASSSGAAPINALVRQALAEHPPTSMEDVSKAYGKLLAKVDKDWQQQLKSRPQDKRLEDPVAEQLRQVLYGPGAPPMVPRDLGWGFLDLLPDRPTQGEFKKLLGAVESHARSAPGAPPRAMVLVDATIPHEPAIFLRGNPNREGQHVPRRFLKVLSPVKREPFAAGSGRLELARAIVDPKNPLTARVMVNRIWQQHFGVGLVDTPSDFGLRSSPPSHPQLLDWLASKFVAGDWSVKRLHRMIMTSAVYRQSSSVSRIKYERSLLVDSANRLLWRFPRRRLDFESTRDAQLFVAGAMDQRIGGPPANVLAGYNGRRTIYGFINRMDMPGVMRTFDFPEPAATSPRREVTTVPQQALFFLNHDFVRETARRVLRRSDVNAVTNDNAKVDRIFRVLFGRGPDSDETNFANAFLDRSPAKMQPTPWRYGYGAVDEKTQRVSKFAELTHWSGARLQAGSALPDPKLGWVFHDRTGGHPAATDDRCFILRWVSPVSGQVEITGQLAHRPEPGNGVRGRIVSQRNGIVGEWKVDQSETATPVKTIMVEVGTTIDFVVDWQGQIFHDEFEWPVEIRVAARKVDNASEKKPTPGNAQPAVQAWSSQKQFRQAPRDLWVDYVHALLMTNEFVFVE